MAFEDWFEGSQHALDVRRGLTQVHQLLPGAPAGQLGADTQPAAAAALGRQPLAQAGQQHLGAHEQAIGGDERLVEADALDELAGREQGLQAVVVEAVAQLPHRPAGRAELGLQGGLGQGGDVAQALEAEHPQTALQGLAHRQVVGRQTGHEGSHLVGGDDFGAVMRQRRGVRGELACRHCRMRLNAGGAFDGRSYCGLVA